MKRREFIAGLCVAVPVASRAQQRERLRRIGILVIETENDQTVPAYITALRDELAKLGWFEQRNIRMDFRFGSADINRVRAQAADLVSLAPDVIVTSSAVATRAVQQQTQTIPIIITAIGDPAVNNIVKNIARPEANITGITNLHISIGGKWLELLKDAAKHIETIGLLFNPQLIQEPSYFTAIAEAARALALKTVRIPYRNGIDIVRGIDAFATLPNGGLLVLPPPPAAADRSLILGLAAQHRLPAIYQDRIFAVEGGVMTYGSNIIDRWRRAGYFVDRILRGAKVSELPLEFPNKVELVVNLRAARAIGLTIPQTFLIRADEVIE